MERRNVHAALAKERKKVSDQLDRLATSIYDKLNPNWDVEIRVSKQRCIDMAKVKMLRRKAKKDEAARSAAEEREERDGLEERGASNGK